MKNNDLEDQIKQCLPLCSFRLSDVRQTLFYIFGSIPINIIERGRDRAQRGRRPLDMIRYDESIFELFQCVLLFALWSCNSNFNGHCCVRCWGLA